MAVAVGIGLTGVCTDFGLGTCWAYGHRTIGVSLAVLGAGAVVLGAIGILSQHRAVAEKIADRFCTQCGRRMRRLAGSGSWYCDRCRRSYPGTEMVALATHKDSG